MANKKIFFLIPVFIFIFSAAHAQDTASIDEGVKLISSGLYNDAVVYFDRYITSNPGNSFAWYYRGVAKFKSRQFPESLEDVNKSVELDSNSAESYNILGLIYREQNNTTKALQNFNRAIKLNPELAEAYNNRGMLYERNKILSNAILDFSKALKIKPDYIDAFYNRGYTYLENEDYTNAIKDFTHVIELDSTYINSYLNRGLAFYAIESYKSSIEDLEYAIRLDSANEKKFREYINSAKDLQKAKDKNLNKPKKEQH